VITSDTRDMPASPSRQALPNSSLQLPSAEMFGLDLKRRFVVRLQRKLQPLSGRLPTTPRLEYDKMYTPGEEAERSAQRPAQCVR
jgi:hypothetical protein